MFLFSIFLNILLTVWLIITYDKYNYYRFMWEKGRPETYDDIEWEDGAPEEKKPAELVD